MSCLVDLFQMEYRKEVKENMQIALLFSQMILTAY